MPTLQGVPSHSRSRTSRNRTSSLGPYVPQAEGLILPDGAVGEMTTELLNELVHHHSENTPISEDTGASDADPSKLKPSWWRRPSPWWLVHPEVIWALPISDTHFSPAGCSASCHLRQSPCRLLWPLASKFTLL